MQEQAERQAALERERKEAEFKQRYQDERKKSPHYHPYRHPKDFKLDLHGHHGFKKLKGKNIDETKSAATALENDIELKQNKETELIAHPSYLTLTRGPSSFQKTLREEDSFAVKDLSPSNQNQPDNPPLKTPNIPIEKKPTITQKMIKQDSDSDEDYIKVKKKRVV